MALACDKAKKRGCPRPLPTDVICQVLSHIHILDRIRIMTTCKDWYGDIREMCSRQTVIAFRFKETRYSFRQCHVKSHFIPETEVIPIDPNYMQRMSNNDAKAAFYKLFPNLKVITIQTSLGKDFISPYQQSLECLHVVSLNWTRSGPESFERITCMAMDDATGNRISKKTFPSLKSLTTGPGIEFFIRSLPSHLTRLHCSVISIIKIGNADFASNLTHLRMDIVRCGLSSTFSFPNLKSLVIKDASGFKIIEMTSVMATHMKVPKLKSLGLFLNRWVYSWESKEVIKFLKSLPKLDALALSISGPLKEEDLLEMVIKSQPGISMFYWDHFPTNPDLLIQLSCLSSIHIFGIGKTLHTLLHTLPRECVMQMLQSPFMQQLTHFHGITILERSYTIKVPLPDYAEKEIKSLKKGKLEDFEDKNGLLHDVFMQQISLLGL